MGRHLNISSVIIIPHPDHIEKVRQQLESGGLTGVELHAVSPEGKMIATIEADDDKDTVRAYEFISQMPGVMSASMVYHQQEDKPELEIAGAA